MTNNLIPSPILITLVNKHIQHFLGLEHGYLLEALILFTAQCFPNGNYLMSLKCHCIFKEVNKKVITYYKGGKSFYFKITYMEDPCLRHKSTHT